MFHGEYISFWSPTTNVLLYNSFINNIAALRLDCKIQIRCKNTKYSQMYVVQDKNINFCLFNRICFVIFLYVSLHIVRLTVCVGVDINLFFVVFCHCSAFLMRITHIFTATCFCNVILSSIWRYNCSVSVVLAYCLYSIVFHGLDKFAVCL